METTNLTLGRTEEEERQSLRDNPSSDIAARYAENDDHGSIPNRRVSRIILPNANIDNNASIEFVILPEYVRFGAYIAFWIMCIFAVIITNIFVAPILEEGPIEEGSTCPPFETGEGFDIHTNSHLARVFGFNNICSNWDYSPSRELTAMIYPVFEYTLLAYLVLDFWTIWLNFCRGYLPRWYWKMTLIFFPMEMILASWFRMIFVIVAYIDVGGHTAGYTGLQIALILVSVQNTLFVLATNSSYKLVGGLRNTQILACLYLIGNFVISIINLPMSFYIVINGAAMPFSLRETGIEGFVVVRLVDYIWMVFNAFIPLIISFIRARSEVPLVININMKQPIIFNSVEEEEEEDKNETEEEEEEDKKGIKDKSHEINEMLQEEGK